MIAIDNKPNIYDLDAKAIDIWKDRLVGNIDKMSKK